MVNAFWQIGALVIFTAMNLLAHAYLSFNQPDILAGNMINDYVKGKKKFDYPAGIQKGMALHRAIDEFTDHHPATQQAKQYFKADYRLYAGAFVDVLYDHFLANDSNQFKDEAALKLFCQSTYKSLQINVGLLPLKFQQTLPYMQSQDWLYNYRFKKGIGRGFEGLVRRAAYLSDSTIAFTIFNTHYHALEICYDSFFSELKQFSLESLNRLNNEAQ